MLFLHYNFYSRLVEIKHQGCTLRPQLFEFQVCSRLGMLDHHQSPCAYLSLKLQTIAAVLHTKASVTTTDARRILSTILLFNCAQTFSSIIMIFSLVVASRTVRSLHLLPTISLYRFFILPPMFSPFSLESTVAWRTKLPLPCRL